VDRVSVLVATYNRVGTLLGCIDAILRQRVDCELEVCIVNDGGIAVESAVHDFQARFHQQGAGDQRPLRTVRVRDNVKNSGQVDARNRALRMATGNFIAICDDDDRWTAEHVHFLLETLHQATPDVSFVHSDAELVGVATDGASDVLFRQPFAFQGAAQMLQWTNPIVPSSTLYTRRLQEQVGLFDAAVDHYWDWDFWLRAANETKLLRAPRATVLYAVDAGGGNQSANPATMQEAFAVFQRKHRLAQLPSSNFLRMATEPALAQYRASTEIVWDGTSMWPRPVERAGHIDG